METRIRRDKNLDLYSPNSDWSGSRSLENNHEIVEYKKDSTVRVWCNEQSNCYPPHWHTALEIIVPTTNYYDTIVADKPYHLDPGDIFIIPSGETHQLIAPESGQRFVYMLDTSLVSRIPGFSGMQSFFMEPLHITKTAYPGIYDEVSQQLLLIRNEYFAQNEFYALAIYSLLLNFFVTLGRNHLSSQDIFQNVRSYKQKEYVQKFNDVLDYIDDHYMDELSLDDIASQIGFSKYHFTRLFKQYTNSTFYDYLSHKRVRVAADLLEKQDLSITEIAFQSGFSSISTFNRIFKQYKDCAPSEYRTLTGHFHTTRH